MARCKPKAPYTPPTITADALTLSAGLASALLDWASEDGTRSMLCGLGVSVADGTTFLCATDGHRLVRVPMMGQGLGCKTNAMWSRTKIERAIKLAKVDGNATIALAWSDVESGLAFPPCDSVVPAPKLTPETLCALNPAYLAEAGSLGATLAKLTDDAVNTIVVVRTIDGEYKPMRIDVMRAGYTLATLVIMPMRADIPQACVYEAPAKEAPVKIAWNPLHKRAA